VVRSKDTSLRRRRAAQSAGGRAAERRQLIEIALALLGRVDEAMSRGLALAAAVVDDGAAASRASGWTMRRSAQ
jgi:hypothetical protein